MEANKYPSVDIKLWLEVETADMSLAQSLPFVTI
jgi:hypothetical protein